MEKYMAINRLKKNNVYIGDVSILFFIISTTAPFNTKPNFTIRTPPLYSCFPEPFVRTWSHNTFLPLHILYFLWEMSLRDSC